jgi:tRNA C32,U32 (ribose-2'-O)-methylase TrmJ
MDDEFPSLKTEKFFCPAFAQKNESFALLFGREKYGFL